MLRYVPKKKCALKKNAQRMSQGAWMLHMGLMACFEVDTKYHLLDFKNKRTPLKLVNPYHIVAHMSSIKSEKI
jgi:hypothetical protein